MQLVFLAGTEKTLPSSEMSTWRCSELISTQLILHPSQERLDNQAGAAQLLPHHTAFDSQEIAVDGAARLR